MWSRWGNLRAVVCDGWQRARPASTESRQRRAIHQTPASARACGPLFNHLLSRGWPASTLEALVQALGAEVRLSAASGDQSRRPVPTWITIAATSSVQSRKCAVDLLMGVSPGAFTEKGIWTRGPSQK
jgi:hypothetical protein